MANQPDRTKKPDTEAGAKPNEPPPSNHDDEEEPDTNLDRIIWDRIGPMTIDPLR